MLFYCTPWYDCRDFHVTNGNYLRNVNLHVDSTWWISKMINLEWHNLLRKCGVLSRGNQTEQDSVNTRVVKAYYSLPNSSYIRLQNTRTHIVISFKCIFGSTQLVQCHFLLIDMFYSICDILLLGIGLWHGSRVALKVVSCTITKRHPDVRRSPAK